MLGAVWRGVKGITGLVGGGLLAAGADHYVTGGKITEDLVGGVGKALGFGQNEAKAEGGYNWIGQLIEMLSRLLKDTVGESGLTQSMDRLSARMQNKDVQDIPGYTGGPDPRGPNGGSNGPNNDGGPGWGTAAAVVGGLGLTGAGVWGAKRLLNARNASAAVDDLDDGYKVMQSAQAGISKASNVADDVARGAAAEAGFLSKASAFFGKFGRFGRPVAIGLTALATTVAVTSPAEAASIPGGGATINAGAGTLKASAAEMSGVGLSILGTNTAIRAIAPVAGSLGIKAIPGIAAIYAAGEGIYNTASYALKGEWAKAGLSAVSGVGETVAGLGGALTYFTIGTAWREAVRAGGAMAFGEENTIEHSGVVQLGSFLKDQFFGATNPSESAPTSAATTDLRFGNRQPALAFGQ